MNTKELREKTLPELNDQLAKLKEELFHLRFQLAINQLDNPHKIADVKKAIAENPDAKAIMINNYNVYSLLETSLMAQQ